MSAGSNIISLRPDDRVLEAAWDAYDHAAIAMRTLYDDPASTRHQRLEATYEATRLHAEFVKLFNRACA